MHFCGLLDCWVCIHMGIVWARKHLLISKENILLFPKWNQLYIFYGNGFTMKGTLCNPFTREQSHWPHHLEYSQIEVWREKKPLQFQWEYLTTTFSEFHVFFSHLLSPNSNRPRLHKNDTHYCLKIRKSLQFLLLNSFSQTYKLWKKKTHNLVNIPVQSFWMSQLVFPHDNHIFCKK